METQRDHWQDFMEFEHWMNNDGAKPTPRVKELLKKKKDDKLPDEILSPLRTVGLVCKISAELGLEEFVKKSEKEGAKINRTSKSQDELVKYISKKVKCSYAVVRKVIEYHKTEGFDSGYTTEFLREIEKMKFKKKK